MTHAIIREMRSGSSFSVCWLGNLSWLVQAPDRLIAFDLDLDLDLRLEPSPISAAEIAPDLDVHFITHGHGDHFNPTTSKVLATESNCLFAVPANCEQKALDIGVPEQRLRMARPGQPFRLPGIEVEPLRALHGDRKFAVYRHANLDDCGYLLTMGGKRILQPGDTVLLQEHLELTEVDVLFVSPTVHNMFVDRSAILINTLEPDHIFPQHFGTYRQREDNLFWTKGYPDEVRTLLPASLQERYHILKQGEVFPIE